MNNHNSQSKTFDPSVVKLSVISKKTGHVYQKQSIEKHLSSFPYCPITNQSMTIDDLIPIQVHEQERLKPQQSIAVILENLKKEYDVLVLEKFYLRKNNQKVKKELAHSLTANQAAQMAIGRLLKEKESLDKEILEAEGQLVALQKEG